MRLYEPIVSGGRVMLQAGRTLTEVDVGVLRRRYPGLCVRVEDPLLDGLIEFEDDSREREVAWTTKQRVSECMATVHDRFAGRTSLRGVDVHAVRETVKELMEYLKANPVSAALVASCMDNHSYLGEHTGNVFYLSVLLGSAVLDYVIAERRRQIRAHDVNSAFASDLTPLGLGAMLMDLGMVPIWHLLVGDRELSPEDRERVRQHPVVGYQMLPDSFSSVARVIVKTHHENLAGTGYPKGLPGRRLHIFARIVRIADAFDAATSTQVYRAAKSPARVLWEMSVGPYRGLYDAYLMNAFARLIQPFPVGCKLRLSDGRYAAVVKYSRQNPFDPTVVIAFDADGRPLPPGRLEGPLRLSTRRDLRIASLHGEDLSFMYSEASKCEPPMSGGFTTPLEAAYP